MIDKVRVLGTFFEKREPCFCQKNNMELSGAYYIVDIVEFGQIESAYIEKRYFEFG